MNLYINAILKCYSWTFKYKDQIYIACSLKQENEVFQTSLMNVVGLFFLIVNI
jgi:hypothetical protein